VLLAGQAARIAGRLRHEWRRFVVGGVCSTLPPRWSWPGPGLAPVGYVAALRESSVIPGAAGRLILHERLGRSRLASALVVTAGLVLLIVWQ
jgi:drug/metabolite transporter (DMT)-like permease